jgi:F-box-like
MILDLPNETLHHIFSFLPDPSHVNSFVCYQENDEEYEVSQILVLRSVCRRFRTLAAELDFWYDIDFAFGELIPGLDISTHLSWRNLQEERFLKVLFADAGLVNSLGRRKTDWKFQSIGSLKAVMQSVSLFRQNARVIYLEILGEGDNWERVPSPLNVAIKNLALCSGITTLNTNLANDIDLDEIANSFPSLETLSLDQNGSCRGSLQRLSRLRKLHVDDCDGNISDLSLYLPLNSAETLTELDLRCSNVGNPAFDTSSLDAFINLKSLAIGPLCDGICDFIIRSQIQLDVFDATIVRRYLPIEKFVEMLRAQSLRNLKEFELSNWNDEISDRLAIKQYWFRIFDAFTSLLPSVEEVQLSAPLHLGICPLFARMVNLKLLNWDGTTHPVFGCRRRDDPKEMVKRALDATFVNFREKPLFAVHFLG